MTDDLDDILAARIGAEVDAKLAAALSGILQGAPGKSAYEVAVDNGFVGTPAEWLASLAGGSSQAGDASFGGRMTLSAGLPEMSVDTTSGTIFYAPFSGQTFPYFDGAQWVAETFIGDPTDQVGPSLSCGAKWTAGSKRDVFITEGGVLLSGPAWPSDSLSARGLVRHGGRLVNAGTLVGDTSSTATVTVEPRRASYIGSIYAKVAGQITAQFSPGKDRIYGLWNAHNQRPITLHACPIGMSTFVPTNQYPALAVYGNDPLNRANVFTGLPTEVDVAYHANFFVNSVSGPSGVIGLVLWDGVDKGSHNVASSDMTNMASVIGGGLARYVAPAVVGLHTAAMGVQKMNTATSTVFGAVDIAPPSQYTAQEGNSMLLARYVG